MKRLEIGDWSKVASIWRLERKQAMKHMEIGDWRLEQGSKHMEMESTRLGAMSVMCRKHIPTPHQTRGGKCERGVVVVQDGCEGWRKSRV